MVDLTYEAHVEPDSLPGRAYPRLPDDVSPQSYGSAVGQGLEGAGNILQNAQDKLQAASDKVEAQARQTQLADFHNQAQQLSMSLTHDPQTGAFTKQGKNAFGLDQQYLPQFDDQIAPLIQNVSDPRARQAAMQTAAQLRTQLSEQLDSHELSQHAAFADQTDLASVHIAQQAGPANYNHADILASNHDTIGVSLDQMGARKGWSDDQIAQAKQEAYSKFHSDVIDRMATDGKFQMAQHYLDVNKSDMDSNTAWSTQRMLTAQLKEKQNEQKQDIADRYNDSMQAAQFGLKSPITVSRNELNILYPKDAQRHWDGLQMVAAAGAQAQEFDHMTPDAINAKVDAARPTQGGPEAAFQIGSYETLARAAQQSIQGRTKDPAQFAIDSGAGWQPLDLRNTQSALQNLKSRANTQDQMSEQLGVNTPLLTKPETAAFTSFLDKQSPADRLNTLTALRQTMPTDTAYASLLKSIAPGSPLTAIAGATLDRPAKADAPSWYQDKFANSPILGQRILEGEEILHDKGEKGIKSTFPMPPDKDLQNGFQAAIGGSNSDLFRGRPDTLQAYYAAYKAYYAAEASHQGVSNGIINSGIADKAAESVIGPATTYGHTAVTVPAGMDPTHFEGAVNAASQTALAAAGYSATDIKALRGYGLRELGDTLGTGRYVVINGNGDPLKGKDGSKTVVIDLNQQFKGPSSPPITPVTHTAFAGKGGSSITPQADSGT